MAVSNGNTSLAVKSDTSKHPPLEQCWPYSPVDAPMCTIIIVDPEMVSTMEFVLLIRIHIGSTELNNTGVET